MLRPSFALLAVLAAALIGFGSVAGGVGIIGAAGILLVGIIIIFAHNEILLSRECKDSICGGKEIIHEREKDGKILRDTS